MGNVLVELIHQSDGIYTAEGFQVEYEKEYIVEAKSPGLETVSAKAAIPKSFNCKMMDHDEENYLEYLCRTFEIEIEDNPNEENYYLIDGWVDILNGEHQDFEIETNGYILPHTGFLSNDINAENTALASGFDITSIPLDYVFLTDENFNGQKYKLEFGLHDEDLIWDKDFELEAHISVKSVSKDMYEYFKSITSYKLNNGNPLAEPTQIFSNIEKGVGIFAGYSEQQFVVDLPGTGFWFGNNNPDEPYTFDIENGGCSGPCTVKFSALMGEKVIPNWDFGDGTTSTERNPEHEYQSAGSFEVSLNVTFGGYGYLVTQTIEIK